MAIQNIPRKSVRNLMRTMQKYETHHMFSISTVRLKYYVNIRIFAWQSENKKRKYRANIHATYAIWTDAINFLFFSLSQKSVLQLLKPSIKSTSLTETHVRPKSTYGSIYMIYSVSTSFDSGDGYKNQNKIDSCGHSMCQSISTATMTTIHVYCVFYSKREIKRVTIFLLIINKTDKMCCFF